MDERFVLHEYDGRRAVLHSPRGNLLIEVCSDAAFHVVYTGRETFSSAPSKVVIRKDAFSSFTFKEEENHYILFSARLTLHIDKRTGAFRWYDEKGRLLVKEPDKGGKFLVEKEVYLPQYDADTVIREIESADGVKSSVTAGKPVFDRNAYSVKLQFEFGNEAIYGLGQHEEGFFNYRGHSQYLYQQNMKLAVPMIVSTNRYGILLDCMSFGAFHDSGAGSYLWCGCEDELDFYFMRGDTFDDVIAQYRFLTGDVPLFPKWAYGFVQSKEKYNTQEELVETVAEYRKRQVPIDCVVQDWQYWQGEKWGDKNLDKSRYPDFSDAVSRIHAMNCKVMVSVWPNMMRGGANQLEMRAHGALLADQMVYNAFDEKAGDLYWKQAKEGLFDHGIDAWWCDSTEPYYADWQGAVEPELTERTRLCVDEFLKFIDPERINGYSLYHSDNIHRNQRKCSDKRVLSLTRSYFPGQQRMSTMVWSGDISARWDVFKTQFASALNVTVTGMPNWTYDIGAFFAADRGLWFWRGDFDAGAEDPGYREFFVRMFQAAVYLPMMRAHGTDTPREIWRFGEEGTPFYDAVKTCILERYALLPYLYSLAAMQTFSRYTALRSMVFDFMRDENTWNISDQFMLGPAFLICPVFEAMFYGVGGVPIEGKSHTRTVYLPKGCDWYRYSDGERLDGGKTICEKVGLERIPVFVRAGSIVIRQAPVQFTGQQPAYYEVNVYAGGDVSFLWYDDSGDGYNYEQGEFCTICLEWKDKERLLILGGAEGDYPGMRLSRSIRLRLTDESGTVQKHIQYDGGKQEIVF